MFGYSKAASCFKSLWWIGLTWLVLVIIHPAKTMLAAEEPSSSKADTSIAKVGEFEITLAAVDRVVKQRFPKLDRESIDAESLLDVQRAVALNLVRRELAYRRLIELGGNPLKSRILRKLDLEAKALQRIDASAVLTSDQQREVSWNVAWGEYLESHLTEDNLRKFYQSVSWKYDGTRIQVAQIFSAQPDAKELLDNIRSSIESNEVSFAAAAKEHSQAPSAAEGGQLGWVQYQGDLPLEVADQTFVAEPKTIIGPVRSPLGWHLVHVTDKQLGDKTFDDLRDQASLRRDAADFLFARLVRNGYESTSVEWLVPQFAPPAAETVAP